MINDSDDDDDDDNDDDDDDNHHTTKVTNKQYNNRFCLRNSILVSALKNLISRGYSFFFFGGGGGNLNPTGILCSEKSQCTKTPHLSKH